MKHYLDTEHMRTHSGEKLGNPQFFVEKRFGGYQLGTDFPGGHTTYGISRRLYMAFLKEAKDRKKEFAKCCKKKHISIRQWLRLLGVKGKYHASQEVDREKDIRYGLYIKSVRNGSPAAKAGLTNSDVIWKIGLIDIKASEDFEKAVNTQGSIFPAFVRDGALHQRIANIDLGVAV